MVNIIFSLFCVKAHKATTVEEINSCENLIERMFGRVMRLNVEPLAQEKCSSHIQYIFCSGKDNEAIAVVKVIDGDYVAQSDTLLREYRLDQRPQEL